MSDQDYREYHCGAGIFTRKSKREGMKAGEVVMTHRHHFPHCTFITHGEAELALLDVTVVNALGHPLEATVLHSQIISADDDINWFLVLAGKWHTIKARVDGTRYQCTYAARLPTSITMHLQGDRKTLPLMKRDENGVIWYREDPHIVETSEWAEAYR